MFSITVSFRPSRSGQSGRKSGIVYFRIARRGANEPRIERCVNSDIRGDDEDVLQIERERIIAQIRLLYCVMERREELGVPFGIDDVVNDFRDALFGAESMAGIIARSRTDFPLRHDLVSVGREFRGAFKYVFPNFDRGNGENLFDYIFGLTQSLKNARRDSQAKNFASLQSSLREFAKSDEIRFSDIDAGVVHGYAGWLERKGIAGSTQSFYLRTLRTILNKAHSDGLVKVSPDWFRSVNTRIYRPSDSGNEILSREMLLALERLDLSSDEQLALVRDMFMFGFYCEGMELVDVANLTAADVRNGLLVYRRRQKGLKKVVVLGVQAKKIITRYCVAGRHHLFPLLDKTNGIMFSTVSNYVRQHLKTIGKSVGFPTLTFSMNISAYRSLASSVSVSEMLLKHDDAI